MLSNRAGLQRERTEEIPRGGAGQQFYIERMKKQRLKIQELQETEQELAAKLQQKDAEIARLQVAKEKTIELQRYRALYQDMREAVQQSTIDRNRLYEYCVRLQSKLACAEEQLETYSRQKFELLRSENARLEEENDRLCRLLKEAKGQIIALANGRSQESQQLREQLLAQREIVNKLQSKHLELEEFALRQSHELEGMLLRLGEKEQQGTRLKEAHEADLRLWEATKAQLSQAKKELAYTYSVIEMSAKENECFRLHLANANDLIKRKKGDELNAREQNCARQAELKRLIEERVSQQKAFHQYYKTELLKAQLLIKQREASADRLKEENLYMRQKLVALRQSTCDRRSH